MFLFHSFDWRWLLGALSVAALLAWTGDRMLSHRRWRRRLQRRRQIRARLYGVPVREIDLRDPPVRAEPAALRDRYVAR